MQPLAPDWDRDFMQIVGSGRLAELDTWTVEAMTRDAGHSSHEVRTWVAAYGALAAFGPYRATSTYYRAIPELIAGFGIATAQRAS
jgi:2,3-dihydroxyphenylpropionate 1,2-dioxygenase